ncbi:hypothetical protein ACP275_09G062000 [Erythranthe tilingii]
MKTLEFQTTTNGGAAAGADPMEEDDQQQVAAVPPPEEPTELDSISYHILEEILTRVPGKTVFCCMAVNTPWLSILDNRRFFKKHHSLSSARPLVVFSNPLGSKSNRVLHLYEGRTASDFEPRTRNLLTRIEFPDMARGRRTFLQGVNPLVTSCKGLTCWATRRGGGDVVISNPITGEYILANTNARGRKSYREVASIFVGLGFSRRTNTFELLKMTIGLADQNDFSMTWYPELLALGARSWRRAGVAPQLDFSRMIYDLMYVDDGTMYWRYKNEPSICAFDFDLTLFRVVDLPEFEGPVLKTVSLGVLDDTLCVSFVSPDDSHVELWSASKTVVDHNGGAHGPGQTTNWKKLYHIETLTTMLENSGRVWSRGAYRPIMYVENNKILMHDWRTNFLMYDVVTGSESVFPITEDIRDEDGHRMAVQVVSHVPNIISMRETLNIQQGSYVRVYCTDSRKTTRIRGTRFRGISTGEGSGRRRYKRRRG